MLVCGTSVLDAFDRLEVLETTAEAPFDRRPPVGRNRADARGGDRRGAPPARARRWRSSGWPRGQYRRLQLRAQRVEERRQPVHLAVAVIATREHTRGDDTVLQRGRTPTGLAPRSASTTYAAVGATGDVEPRGDELHRARRCGPGPTPSRIPESAYTSSRKAGTIPVRIRSRQPYRSVRIEVEQLGALDDRALDRGPLVAR